MIDFDFSINDLPVDQEFAAFIRRLSPRAQRAFLVKCAGIGRSSIRKTIRQGGRPSKWPRLKQTGHTKDGGRGKAKTKRKKGGKALQGRYRFSISATGVGDDEAWIGVRPWVGVKWRKIVRYHELGLGHNPKRSAIMWQQEDARAINELAEQFIDTGSLRRARGGSVRRAA